MQETRRKTPSFIEGLDQVSLDWHGPDGQENSIGSLLFHMALVERTWLHYDFLCMKEFPIEVK